MNRVEYINKYFMRVWLKYYPKEFYNKRNNIKTKTFTEALENEDYEYLLFKSIYYLREYTEYVKASKVKVMLRTYSIKNNIEYSIDTCISILKQSNDKTQIIDCLQQIALNCIEILRNID